MSVEPGFSGQKFLPETFAKLDELSTIRREKNLSFAMCVDGGVSQENIVALAEYGVDQCAAANAVFSENDPVEATQRLASMA